MGCAILWAVTVLPALLGLGSGCIFYPQPSGEAMGLVLENKVWGEWKGCPSRGARALGCPCEILQGALHSVPRICS